MNKSLLVKPSEKPQLSQATEERLWNSNYTKIWTANFMLYFSFMLLMPLFPLYLRDTFGANKETIGFVLSGYTIAALIIRPISGYLVDTFPRKVILLVFNFLFVALSVGYLVATSITLFALFRTLHGIPFGATTVAGTTVAVDVLHPSRRAEGIGYYGLANNIATAISPTIAIWLLHVSNSYTLLFWLSIIISFIGLVIDYTIKIQPPKSYEGAPSSATSTIATSSSAVPTIADSTSKRSSADTPTSSIHRPETPILQHQVGSAVSRSNTVSESKRYKALYRRIYLIIGKLFLFRGWRLGLSMVCFSLSYGIISTYVAIYALEELGLHEGAALFFFLLAGGLALSRLTGARSLRKGRIVHNASEGMIVSLFGYFLFAAVHHPMALYASALIIGLGNGHMYPAYQNMFINLATANQRGTANSSLLTSWDIGLGIGVLIGGVIAENVHYHASFWAMWVANLLGVITFFALARRHYLTHTKAKS